MKVKIVMQSGRIHYSDESSLDYWLVLVSRKLPFIIKDRILINPHQVESVERVESVENE